MMTEEIEVQRYQAGLEAAVQAFERGAAARFLCQLPCPPQADQCDGSDVAGLVPAVVAVTADGEVVGAGYLDTEGARAALALDMRHADGPGPALVLRALGETAQDLGLARLSTNVIGGGPDMLAAFREAGLNVESSLWTGSVSEIVLGLARLPAGERVVLTGGSAEDRA